MTKIYVYLGENVGSLKERTIVGKNVFYGLVEGKLVIGIDDTCRHLPETGLHPRKYVEKLKRDIAYCEGNWNLHIVTNSRDTLNVLGDAIESGQLNSDSVEIFILDSENQKIEQTVTFDDGGYLKDFPPGFFSY